VTSLFVYARLLPGITWLSSAIWTPVRSVVPTPSWLDAPGPIPSLSPESAIQLHAMTAVDIAIGFTSLWLLFFGAVWLARGRPTGPGVAAVFGVAILAQTICILAPYALSGDFYSYAIYGRIYAVYGGNPYVEAPIQYANDPLYSYVYWVHVPSFYGPLWTLISGQIALIAGSNVGLAVLLFRLIEAVSALLAMLLVFLVLRHLDPERALVGAILIGWCPLVIVESGLSAHNDVLMATLIVDALVLAAQRRVLTSIAAVATVVLAGLIKLTALALLPLLGLYLLRAMPTWRARAAVFFGSGLVAAALGAAIIWPVWAGAETFAVQTLGSGPDRYVNSLAETALGEIRFRLGASRDDLAVPLQFSGWWVGVHTPSTMYGSVTGDDAVEDLPVWSNLVVVGPEREKRLKVFDPLTRKVGYVESWTLGPIDPPAEYANDPEVAVRIKGPVGSADLLEANRLIRLAGWGTFGLALLAALVFGTGSVTRLTTAWIGLCLVLEYVTLTWFWPWYVLWGLMPAALVTRSRFTLLTLYLGWGVMMAYGLMGFQDSSYWFLHNFRALPMFLLPLLLFGGDELLRGLGWLARRPFRRRLPAGISPSVAARLRTLT
jgi:hypothetical protein